MTTKAIWFEWRKPVNLSEKREFGNTSFQNESTAKIFINTDKVGKSSEEAVKTFWHEMTHAFIHFHETKKGMNKNKEEDLCRTVEIILWEILRHV